MTFNSRKNLIVLVIIIAVVVVLIRQERVSVLPADKILLNANIFVGVNVPFATE